MNIVFFVYVLLLGLFLTVSLLAAVNSEAREAIKSNFKLLFIVLGVYLICILIISNYSLLKTIWILTKDAFIIISFFLILIAVIRKFGNISAIVAGILIIGIWYIAIRPMQGSYAVKTYYPEMDRDAELLIEIHEAGGLEKVMPLLIKEGLQIKRAFFPADSTNTTLDNFYTLDIPKRKMHRLKRIKRKLRSNSGIEYLEINEVIKHELPEPPKEINQGFAGVAAITNDPFSARQWGLQFLDLAAANQVLARNKSQLQNKVVVAILDTGIDSKHEDLQSNYTSSGKSNDSDPQGHGTHCAGIIGAVSNNQLGISGVSFSNDHISIRSYKVLFENGIGSQKTIIDGIIKAADDGAGVISLSLGGISRDKKQRAFEEAIKYANEKGAIVVVAAGNNGTDARNFAPANAKGAITVTAIDSTGKLTKFSNKAGRLEQKLAAPGLNILSTFPNNQYKEMSGTSMATPHVAGIIAIMKSIRPDLNSEQAYKILESTGKTGPDSRQSGKIPDLKAALKKL